MIQKQKLQMIVILPRVHLTKNEVPHENFVMDSNDHSKQRLEPEIGTQIQNGPESEVTDCGDTSINVPGDNIETDLILQERVVLNKRKIKKNVVLLQRTGLVN